MRDEVAQTGQQALAHELRELALGLRDVALLCVARVLHRHRLAVVAAASAGASGTCVGRALAARRRLLCGAARRTLARLGVHRVAQLLFDADRLHSHITVAGHR